jgi:hypothetical protein
VLWECVSVVSDDAVAALRARGGVDLMAISHPHFYTSMVEWSEALGGIPILLHEADRAWVQRPSKHIRFWSGDELRLSTDVTLLRVGGHFDGSTGMHWKRGPRGATLLPGDALQVVSDRRHVTFMYSYPNYMPMKPSMCATCRRCSRVTTSTTCSVSTWGRNIGGGRAAVDASFARYLQAVA